MARPRNFDETDVIQRAMQAFWRNGYEATSISELEEATGISRISIYNAFGDKEGLFLAALDMYHGMAVEIYDNTVAKGGLAEIEQLLTMISAETETDSPANAGCLMVNTVLDIRRASPRVRDKIKSYRAMLNAAFTSALENARARGEMDITDDVLAERAEFLVGLLWGALATIRVNADTTSAAPTTRVGIEVVISWRSAAA